MSGCGAASPEGPLFWACDRESRENIEISMTDPGNKHNLINMYFMQ